MPRNDEESREIDEVQAASGTRNASKRGRVMPAAAKRPGKKTSARTKAAAGRRKASTTRGKAKTARGKAAAPRSRPAAKRGTAAKRGAKAIRAGAKTIVRRVKKVAKRGAKSAVAADRSAMKAAKGAVTKATSRAKGGQKKMTVASIAAKARRQNAKTGKTKADYNPLHMLAKLSPF